MTLAYEPSPQSFGGRSRAESALLGGASLALPPTEALLRDGGDTRLALDPVSGCNRYGCLSKPGLGTPDFGSATASTVSPAGYAAADSLRERLARAELSEPRAAIYARELDRVRGELIGLCGLGDMAGLDVVFAASGTDLHLLVAELVAGAAQTPTVCIDIEPEETGSGVPAALEGRHFSGWTALGAPVTAGAGVCAGGGGTEFAAVAARGPDGSLRQQAVIELELNGLIHAAAKAGRKALLTVSDVSKTGLISPGLDVVLAMMQRFPHNLEVLIDACQFRLSSDSLRAYLDHGFMVAVTGSKFLAGPTFSAALLVPPAVAAQLRGRLPRRGLRAYSARAEWPADWVARGALTDSANFGLLLRWEAALTELAAFRAIPEAEAAAFATTFARSARAKFAGNPVFEPLDGRAPDRSAIGAVAGWDATETIFPFLLKHADGPHAGEYLSLAAVQDVYRNLMSGPSPVRLGQPVLCGQRGGRPISALRLCNSARLIVEGAGNGGGGAQAVIDRALAALDATADVARTLSRTGRV